MRNGRQPSPQEYERIRAQEGEVSDAQRQAQSAAQHHADGPLLDMYGEQATELLDRLTDVDIDSPEFNKMEAYLKPWLSQMLMLAAHDEDYYDDLAHELLNENLFDRILSSRRRGQYQTGPFLTVIQDVEHDYGPRREPLNNHTREAMRGVLVDIRTAMQSLGRETFFKGLTEMHVSSEVRREDAGDEKGGGSLLGAINPFN